MRAGDSDRQAVADKLKQAMDEGRLDLAEYDDRLQKTYAAKTYGDLRYFWPVWLLIPMALGALGRFGGGDRRRR